MIEQKIQRQILNYLESIGAYSVKIIAATKAGIPDILACYKGIFLGIEVKTPETKYNVSELQKYNLSQIEKAGGYTAVVWSIEQVSDLIELVESSLND